MPYPVTFMTCDGGVMEEEDVRVTVVDVYDLASDIGKEFEKIIDRCGADQVTGLMPRVISALEHLEQLAAHHEHAHAHTQELKATIAHLEHEKMGKAEDRQRYERELEEIEDRLRAESRELVETVAKLQDQNKRLNAALTAQSQGSITQHNGASPLEVDLKVVKQLQEVIEGQREQLRKTEKEAHSKTSELDCLRDQLDKATHANKEYRRRTKTNAAQMRSLIDERAELQAELQEETRQAATLRQRLGLAQKENEDLASCSFEAPDLTNKLVFDRDDPNRPRFTLSELKEILYERNELKAKVSDLEDELHILKPGSHRQACHILCPPLQDTTTTTTTTTTIPHSPLSDSSVYTSEDTIKGEASPDQEEEKEKEEGEEEPPVQGPMPYEPDDAPWKREESGIRKFFRRLFGDEATTTTTTKIKPSTSASLLLG